MKPLLALFALLGAVPALAKPAAPGLVDLAAIDRAVAGFTGVEQGRPGGAAMPLDRRLRLAACAVPMRLGWYGSRRDTVEVSCPVAGGWRLYVPLVAGADAASPSAPAQPMISKGDALTISIGGEGFAVSSPGEALESGVAGQWIRVRPLGGKDAVLRARVIRPGLTGIDLP